MTKHSGKKSKQRENEVRVSCVGSGSESIDILEDFQGKLKILSKNNYKKLKGQMLRLGFSEPISVWKVKDKIKILNGHQRVSTLKTMRDEGIRIPSGIPVNYVDAESFKEAKEKVLSLTSQYGEMSKDGLAEMLASAEIDLSDAKEMFRFPEIDFKKFEAEFFNYPAVEDEVPEPPKNPITKLGDVWTLGDHVLVCDDLENVTPRQWDLMITDPPYGVSYASKNEFLNNLDKGNRVQDEIENDHKKPMEMYDFWVKKFSHIKQFALGDACYYVTGPQGGDLLLLLLQALDISGFKLKHMLIWAKNNHVLGRCDYHYKHEPILYGWIWQHKWYGDHSQMSLWEIDKPPKSKHHPTMKPVELYARAMKNSSKEGMTVIDPFSGSGTCVIAAEQLNRKCYAIEIEPKYCDVIVERWETLTGGKAKRTKNAS